MLFRSMQAKFWLHQEHGIDNAGPTDVYLSLLDPAGYPLTMFRNDLSVADYNLVIDSPYHCAADSYRALSLSHFRSRNFRRPQE